MIGAIIIWWLVASLLGLAGLPVTRLLLGALPDRGYAFARALGLLLVGYLAWLLAMLGLLPFSATSLTLAALVLAGVGLWLSGGPRTAWARTQAAIRTRWPALLFSEAIFLGALLATVWMRAHDPHPWGTERPMDFAFFNAVQRSGFFPPNDPWLAGFSINYYYFGYVLMGGMALLSGLEPSSAYNLALALIVALTAQGCAGMVSNLIELAGRDSPPPARLARTLVPMLGAIFVLLAANQSGALQVLLGSERAVALDGSELATALGQVASGAPQISLPAPITTSSDAWGTFDGWPREDRLASFNWWWPSRSLWDEYRASERERRYNITEFPLFSFRLGDMHPHVMALPFGLLAAATALAALVRPALPHGGRADLARLTLAGLLIGSLYALNSWDLPTYLLLYAAAVGLAIFRTSEPHPWRTLAYLLLIVVAAAYLLFVPFHLTFHSLVGSAAPLIDLPLIGPLTSLIAPYVDRHSGLHAFLIIFGLFAVPIVTFVYLAGRPKDHVDLTASDEPVRMSRDSQRVLAWERGQPARIQVRAGGTPVRPELSPDPGKAVPTDRVSTSRQAGWLLWLPPGLLLLGLLVGFPLLALAGLGLLAAWQARHLAERPGESFALLLVALGCAIIFGTELIFIRDIFGNRMNTIFKFYYQVWLLWGLLAPFALWWSLKQAHGRLRLVAWGTALLTGLLLLGALVYPWLALGELGRGELIGLQGKTPREGTLAGAASLAWLRQNAAPGSVVLEAVALDNPDAVALGSETPRCGGSYNGEGFAGVAAATGLPTVLGWKGHQQQWRGGDPAALAELEPRCSAVDTIFRTLDPATARDLLANYKVTYVYLGQLERRLYPPEALAKFNAMGETVFEQDEISVIHLQ